MKKITQFFWLCSGSYHAILKRYPSESAKYAGIGATIFFTGIFAALSATYAFYTVFDDYLIAVPAGILWGLMIFNLDRYIVSSLRKRGNFKKEFITALPRLVLALLIAMVISKPLELKIFEKEINNEIVLMKQELRKQQEMSVRDRFNPHTQSIQEEINALNDEIEAKTRQRDQLTEEARKEADGTGGSMRRSAGPIYRLKKADADRVERELFELRETNLLLIDRKRAQIDSLQSQTSLELVGLEENDFNGFASRLDGLSRISEKSSPVHVAHWFIIFLFIAIESAPIFVKLISSKGPYDDRLMILENDVHAIRSFQVANTVTITREKSNHLTEPEKIWLEGELTKPLS